MHKARRFGRRKCVAFPDSGRSKFLVAVEICAAGKVVVEAEVVPDTGWLNPLDRCRMRFEPRHIAGDAVHASHPAAEEIVNECAAVGFADTDSVRRKHDVIIDEVWAVVGFREEVAEQGLRMGVVMQEVSGNPRPLRHPIEPDAAVGSVDVVVRNLDIHRPMELDARHLDPVEHAPDVDAMDLVARDPAECAFETADDSILFAVMDAVVADDVAADGLFVPTVCERPLDRPDKPLGGLAPVSHSSLYFPSAIPAHLEYLMSFSSMIQPLLQ